MVASGILWRRPEFKEGRVAAIALCAKTALLDGAVGDPPALEEELRRLRAEDRWLLMERNILKRATASNHGRPVAENVVDRQFEPPAAKDPKPGGLGLVGLQPVKSCRNVRRDPLRQAD